MLKRFRSYRPEFAEFDNYFAADIKPNLNQDEPRRKKLVKLGILVAMALTPVGIFLAWYFGVYAKDADIRALHFVYMVPAVGYMCVLAGLRLKTKLYLVEKISHLLGWTHTRQEDAEVLAEWLYTLGVLPEYDHARLDDIFRGHHLDWPFQLCEIQLLKTEGHGRNRRVITKFQGFILSFKLAHPTDQTTIISRTGTHEPLNLSEIKYEGHYQDIKGKVKVLSSDRNALMTVLCPRFIAALSELDASFPDASLSCALARDTLHIPVTSLDKFEVDWMFKVMDDPERVQKMLNEFSEILTMLDIVLKRRACHKTGAMDYPEFRKI